MSAKGSKRKSAPSSCPNLIRKLDPLPSEIGRFSDRLGIPVYLVGGAVRDLLLGHRHLDWDIVADGNPGKLVRFLAKEWKGKFTAHDRFGTYVLELNNGIHVDFATARTEVYPQPAVLPVVKAGDINNDLFRRDFTINAMALSLNGKDPGHIIDRYGGREDLKNRVLRVLHTRSFRDDPTRLFRLARFACRGFRIDPGTLKLVLRDKKYVRKLSAERIREELLAVLSEKDPRKALRLLYAWGVLRSVLPGVAPASGVERLPSVAGRLNFLLRRLSDRQYCSVMERLKLGRDLYRQVEALRHPPKPKPILSGNDLIQMGFSPGPLFKTILNDLQRHRFTSRKKAKEHVFDKFSEKI